MSSSKNSSLGSVGHRTIRKISVKPRSNYIETDSGNRISRQSRIKGSQYITLGGKNLVEGGVTIRGDLHRPDLKIPVVSVGRYCIFDENCTVKPPSRLPASLPSVSGPSSASLTSTSEVSDEEEIIKTEEEDRLKMKKQQDNQISPETGRIHFPIKLGNCVYIGRGSVVEAAQIGNYVYIGHNCQIGEFSIIKDCVVIEDGTVVPPYVSISPFSKVSGTPCQLVEELPESTEQVLEVYCRKVYAGIDVGGAPF